MLETLRKQGASIVIYAVFGILIAVFVINFGAQSVGTREGCTSSDSDSAATVDGKEVSLVGWRWSSGFITTTQRMSKRDRSHYALDWLIAREILVKEAKHRGLNVVDDLIDDNLKAGRLFFYGGQFDGKSIYFEATDDKPGSPTFFSYDRLKDLSSNVGMSSMASFKDQQREETLAAMMAQMLEAEPRASKDEALSRFVYENTKVSFDVVMFSPAEFAAAMNPSDADVNRWLAAHDADAKAQYDKDKKSYTGTKPTVKLRQVYVAKAAAPAAPEAPAAGSGAGSASGSAAPAPTTGAGLDKLTLARADILAKKKTFAEVAAALDSDPAQKARSGDLGWRTIEDPSLSDPKLVAAIKTLKPGEVSPVITTDDGYYLITVEDKREGDLAYAQVKHEIASTLARKAWADEAAKRAALAAIEQAAAQKKSLAELFPKDAKKELQRQLQQRELERQIEEMQRQQNGQSGMITVEGKDVPASWSVDDVPAGGVGATPATPAAPAIDWKPSGETLPSMTEIKPEFTTYAGMLKDGKAQGFEAGKEVTAALFDQLTDGMVAPHPFKLEQGYVVVQLTKKQAAQPAEFDKVADAKIADLNRERGLRFYGSWLHDRCHALLKDNRIKYQAGLVRESDDNGKEMPSSYRPCMTFDTEADREAEAEAAAAAAGAPAAVPTN